MVKSEGGHTWVGMQPVEFDILWYYDSAQVILNQNVDSKNSNQLTDRVIKKKYGHIWMVKSDGLHTWVGMHIVEYAILWYHDTVQVILNQNIDSKSTKPLSERVLQVNYGDFLWSNQRGVILG